ncbi:hypothetical protein [Gorillibacterium timonense]|uniref:hypothetical protein n=1 Tax=Gorillibacterium timonense TaxID=1689269 RepID=UPI00071D8A5F|nr:hypothetical protein [Gorillibacterium timonense]
MRRAWKTGWILFLVGFGVFFGIDQAAKQQGENPAAVHRSYWPQADGSQSGGASGLNGSPQELGTRSNTGTSRMDTAGSASVGKSEQTATASGYRDPQAGTIRPVPVGVGAEQVNWGEPTSGANGSSDSFLNRLGNKLGEAVRAFFSAVIGWIVDLFNRILG